MSNLKKGEIFEAVVRDVTSAGMGVVKHESGPVVFVAGVWVGELGRFRLIDVRSRMAIAELKELVKPSPDRVEAPCHYHGSGSLNCGACPWQFVRYEAQLEAKQKRVSETIARFDPRLIVRPIVGSEKIFGYRSRTQLKSDGKRLGFLAQKSHNLVDIEKCLILTDENQKVLSELRTKLPNSEWKGPGKNRLTTLDIDDTVSDDDVSINRRLPFIQANQGQNAYMQRWLSERLVRLDKESKVLELFCGSGNFTKIIAALSFAHIRAYEYDEAAISTLSAQKLKNVQAQVFNLFDDGGVKRLFAMHKDAHVIVMNPPRDGMKCHKQMSLEKSLVEHLFYISCDLATFARDVGYFAGLGFKLSEVQPLDQFPHTPHIEILSYMQRDLSKARGK